MKRALVCLIDNHFADAKRGFKRVLSKPFSRLELRDVLLAGCLPRVVELRETLKTSKSK